VCVLHQLGNVLHAVVSSRPRPERGAANIDGIGAMVDGFNADLKVAGGG
jgi:hypothetical protein